MPNAANAVSRKLVISIYCALILTASGFAQDVTVAKPESVGLSSDRLERIATTVQRNIDDKRIAGAVTLVYRRGKVVWFKPQGMMDREAAKPMRPDAMFRICSMTKPITSVAVMMLYEEGRFLLTDPVSKFIPEFKNPKVMVVNPPGSDRAGFKLVPADREITIQDLLTHTAGLAGPTSTLLRPEMEKFQKEASPDE